MKHNFPWFSVVLFIIVIIMVVSLSSCTVSETNNNNHDTSNMTLVAEKSDIQVWKFTDNSIQCYVTINSQRYEAASIFCIH